MQNMLAPAVPRIERLADPLFAQRVLNSPGARVAAKKPASREHEHYHKDGTLWARGEMTGRVMTGYWEWFRKDGSIMRSGSFANGEQVGEWTTYDKTGRVVKVTLMRAK
jgi:hypothetical protein